MKQLEFNFSAIAFIIQYDMFGTRSWQIYKDKDEMEYTFVRCIQNGSFSNIRKFFIFNELDFPQELIEFTGVIDFLKWPASHYTKKLSI